MKTKIFVAALTIACCTAALVMFACAAQVETEQPDSHVVTSTMPSGYLELSVSPGDISARTGEEIVICCAIYSLVNTPVEKTSVELVVFDSDESLLREQAMTKDSHWSAHTSYTIVGDEAYYKIGVKFSTPLSLPPRDHSDYSVDSFAISIIQ